MRRLLLAFFVFVLLGILLSLVFQHHQGYVLISFAGWQIETSLLFACVALLVGLWVLAVVWRAFTAIVFAKRNIGGLVARRRQRRARRSLYSGLEHMAEARWALAEDDLQALAETNEAPGLNHLLSARAAQYQNHLEDRDKYLAKAAARDSVSDLSVALTQAELQIAAGQVAEARHTLDRLYAVEPRHPWILRLYGEHLLASGDYQRLYDLLPELQKHAALTPARIETMAVAAHRHRLSEQPDVGGLTATWRQVPKTLRADPDMVGHYVHCLSRKKADDEGANVIRQFLKKQWSAKLALLFGELHSSDQKAQLATVEEWLKKYGEEPELLLVAGRMCFRNQLWGRARGYLEASQAKHSRPEALLELGHLLERIDEYEKARAVYRQGLEITVSG